MNVYAIGDIHGYYEALESLLKSVAPMPEDLVVFLGDYVDKGPQVRETLDLLISISQHNSHWQFLRGNHDQTFLDAKNGQSDFYVWESIAGRDPLRSYGDGLAEDVFPLIPETHFQFLEHRCENYFSTEDYIFVHAGIRAHHSPEEEDPDYLQWTSLSLATPHFSGKTVVCGHTSQESGKICDRGHTICIDTGIAKGQFLTCLNLTDRSFTRATAEGQITHGWLVDNSE